MAEPGSNLEVPLIRLFYNGMSLHRVMQHTNYKNKNMALKCNYTISIYILRICVNGLESIQKYKFDMSIQIISPVDKY